MSFCVDGKWDTRTMILQTSPAGEPPLATMMYEHTALCQQFANAFGNAQFEKLSPLEQMLYIISHHDAGWLAYDRAPQTDARTGLPFNLTETPAKYITVTSRLSPDFNERHHPYCGLISSMHSWGLYNGRYGLSDLVLLDKIKLEDRALAEQMLDGELARQERLKRELSKDTETAAWITEEHLFQNYKTLQFIDTLALYFNRIHPAARGEQQFQHVPVSAGKDVTVRIRPVEPGVYALSPYPFASEGSEFGFAGRPVSPGAEDWSAALAGSPTRWERFRIVAG
jgi:hypothetical protein